MVEFRFYFDQVDANYKRMLHYGCMPDNARYVQFGVASHNLFDLCYAMLLLSLIHISFAWGFLLSDGDFV